MTTLMAREGVACQQSFETGLDAQKGRCIIATRDLEPGTNIIAVQPYACVVSNENSSKCCSWCFKYSENSSKSHQVSVMSRCSLCYHTYYCSRNCQKMDWKLHKQECKLTSALHKAGRPIPTSIVKLAGRVILFSLPNFIDSDKPNRKNLYTNVLDTLCDHMSERSSKQVSEFEMLGEMALALISMGMSTEIQKLTLQHWDVSRATKLIGALSCNAFTILADNGVSIGLGLYLDASGINHSCIPNCYQHFNGKKMFIYCIHPVEKGQELTISYTSLTETSMARRKVLQDGYHFWCKCPRCTGAFFGEDQWLIGVACTIMNCSGILHSYIPKNMFEFKKAKEEHLNAPELVCNRCSNKCTAHNVEKTIKTSEESIERGLELMNSTAINEVEKYNELGAIEKWIKMNFIPCSLYCMKICELRRDICAHIMDADGAARYSLSVAKCMKTIYSNFGRQNHPIVGLELRNAAMKAKEVGNQQQISMDLMAEANSICKIYKI